MPANNSVAELSIDRIAGYGIQALFLSAVKKAFVAGSFFFDDIGNSDEFASLREEYFIIVPGFKAKVARDGRNFKCIVRAVKHELVKRESID